MTAICVIVGTRPEAIKLAPVIRELRARVSESDKVVVCSTGQHRELLDSVLRHFEIAPEHELRIMTPGQGLSALFARAMTGIGEVLEVERPDIVVVHGDTVTTAAAGLACFYNRVRVAHVEAGLRTHDLAAPWPEELNRRIAGLVSTLHFAPTERARANLLTEGVPLESIWVTGNTVIDALQATVAAIRTRAGLAAELARRYQYLGEGRRTVLVTGHRRENIGDGVREICAALRALGARGDVHVIYPVHPNPAIQEPVQRQLAGVPGVSLISPLEYVDFVFHMMHAKLILTDSGGVQEEAPSLGVPVLVMREVTERAEGVEAGTVRLVGASAVRILDEANRLLDDPVAYSSMSAATNPYGDGRASERIASVLLRPR